MAALPLSPSITPVPPRPSLAACVFVIVWACGMRLLALGTVQGHPDDRPWAIVAGAAVGTACVVAITRLLAWRRVRATTSFQWISLYFLTMVPSTVLMVTVFIVLGLPGAGGAAYVVVPAATWGTSMGLAWVLDQYVSRLRTSADLRERLGALVRDTAVFDDLLARAEESTFDAYSDVIQRRVQEPLRALRETSEGLDDDAYARELDALVAGTMRPLAHLLHPVSVRAGLLPALRSLGSRIEIDATAEIVDADAAGALLEANTRVQIYRWARQLIGDDASVVLVMWTSDGRLHLEARGARPPAGLDPIQLIAGLTSHAPSHVSAPLQGTDVNFEPPALVRPRRRARPHLDWRQLLTPATVISPGIVALVCLITAPALSFINSVTVSPAVLTALAIAVLLPTALAFACRGIRVPRGTTRGALGALAVWACVGLASALAQIVVLSTFSGSTMTRALTITLVVRGLARLLIPGSLWMAIQSLARVNEDEAGELRRRLDALRESRRQTLVQADHRDQEVSETLHRTIQGRLSAASLMLRMDRRAEADVVIDGILDVTLPSLLESLRPAVPSAGVPSAQARPDSRWTEADLSGLAITGDVDWEAITSASPDLARDLRRSIAENLSNAARHGRATTASLSARVSPESITITCRDNGAGPQPDSVPGLGSRIHDQVAARYHGSWSVERMAYQTVFTMHVQAPRPLEQGAPRADDAGVEPGEVEASVEPRMLDLDAPVLHDGKA